MEECANAAVRARFHLAALREKREKVTELAAVSLKIRVFFLLVRVMKVCTSPQTFPTAQTEGPGHSTRSSQQLHHRQAKAPSLSLPSFHRWDSINKAQ